MHLEIASPEWVNIPEDEFYQLQVSIRVDVYQRCIFVYFLIYYFVCELLLDVPKYVSELCIDNAVSVCAPRLDRPNIKSRTKYFFTSLALILVKVKIHSHPTKFLLAQ